MNDYLTKEDYQKLKEELDYLKTVKRKEIAERLNQAIDFGDLMENAAYHEAKEAQGFIEGRILELGEKLRNAKIIEEKNQAGLAGIGSEIWLKADRKKKKFKIVGAGEVDPLNGKISAASPLGKALLGKRVGETIFIEETKYEIIHIE